MPLTSQWNRKLEEKNSGLIAVKGVDKSEVSLPSLYSKGLRIPALTPFNISPLNQATLVFVTLENAF